MLTKKPEHKNGFDRQLLREVAYDRLKNAIRTGELQPGEPLYELHLSELLQISRTPVREALQQLVFEGLVKNMPNRAMTVASLSMQEVLNVLHVRSLIEPEIVRLVAESAAKEAVDRLTEAIEAMEKAAEIDDRVAWSRSDTLFHETLSDACPNALLGQLGLQMRDRMHLVAIDVQTPSKRLKVCTEEHHDILDAIAQQDGERAKEAMQRHIQNLRESFFRRLTHG